MVKKFNGDIVQWLRGFYHVAMSGSLSAAARQMGINRSAVRHHLTRLEEELGVSLLDRSVEPMRLTGEGVRLLRWAESVFDTVRNMVDDVSNAGESVRGCVNLFTQQYIGLFVLHDVMRDFLAAYPEVSFNLQTGTQGRALRQLDARRSELALCAAPSELEAYDFEELFQDRHLLCCRKGCFRLSETPSREELESLPYIGFSTDAAQPSTDEIFAALHIRPRKIISVDSDLLALEYVKAGFGASVLRERQCARDAEILDVRALDELPPPAAIGFLSLKGAYVSPLVRVFRTFCAARLKTPQDG